MKTIGSYEELRRALTALKPDDPEDGLALVLTRELAEAILAHDPLNRKLRPAKVEQYARTIKAGTWRPSRSLPLMFLPDGRLGDGQHRCHAVVEAGTAIPVRVIVVSDTYGVDEGAPRTLIDYLDLTAKLEKREGSLAALVTRTLCPTKAPTDEELMAFFQANAAFILECVQKPLAWLSEHQPDVARAIKPTMLATVRAKAIREESLPEAAVDELLYDVVNGAVKGGPGSYAEQISRELHMARSRAKRVGLVELVRFIKGSIEAEQTGAKVKNIITAARKGKKKTVTREAA